jgi:hypothetical protein
MNSEWRAATLRALQFSDPAALVALYWETIGQLPQSQLPPISFSAMIETIVDRESQGDIQSQVQTF